MSQPALRLGLTRDAVDGRVAHEAVTDRGSDRSATERDSCSDQCSHDGERMIHRLSPRLMSGGGSTTLVLLFQSLAGHSKVDHSEQHEDERLDRANQEHIE